MNVISGEFREVTTSSDIDESEVRCPNSVRAQNMMTAWGKSKRQQYAHLVKNKGYECYQAFYIVEFDKNNLTNIKPLKEGDCNES